MSTGFRVWPKSRSQTRAHPRRYQVRVRPRRRRDDPPDRRDQHPGLLQVLAEGLVRGEARRRAGARHDPYKDETIPAAPDELVVELSQRYIKLYEMITGEKFEVPPTDVDVKRRIDENVGKALGK